MYKKRKMGWREHFDFILMDIMVLLVMFYAVIWRHTEFGMMELVSTIIIMVLFKFLFDILTDIHNEIMYRGVLKEFALSIVNVAISGGFMFLYLIYIE